MNIPKGLIVSCQIEPGSSFAWQDVYKFANEAIRGGCVALRIRGCASVYEVRKRVDHPIIGLTKGEHEDGTVCITPSFVDAMSLVESGADYVAVDATGRSGYGHIKRMHEEGVKLIGDVSNFDQAQSAIESGCECLTTTLSGYTKDCKYNEEPDYKLLEELVSTNIPVLAEGRYWERSQVKKAFDLGAHAVVVGSAITRPHLITERLCVL